MSAHPHDRAGYGPAARADLVRAVHAAPVAAVLELAGGTQGLAWLHAVGGSSATVLEAHDRYHHDSLATALRARPARAPPTARGPRRAGAA